MNGLLTLALTNAVLAGALVPVAYAVTRIWRNPHIAHAMWLLVLLKLVTPPIISISGPAFSVHSSSLTLEHSEHSRKAISIPLEQDGDPGATAAPLGARPVQADARKSREPLMESGYSVVSEISWPHLLGALWVTGSILWVAIAVLRIVSFQHKLIGTGNASQSVQAAATHVAKLLGMKQCPDLRVVDGSLLPMVWPGIGRPTVLVPRRLTAELTACQLQTILAHEFGHILRRDHWVRWFELLCTAAYWWHPALSFARNQLRMAEESCCDAIVLAHLPRSEGTYCEALLHVVEFSLNRSPVLATGIHTGRNLKRRIEMLMSTNPPKGLTKAARFALAIVVVAVLSVSLRTFDEQAVVADSDVKMFGLSTGEFDTGESDSTIDKSVLLNKMEAGARSRLRRLRHGHVAFKIRHAQGEKEKGTGKGKLHFDSRRARMELLETSTQNTSTESVCIANQSWYGVWESNRTARVFDMKDLSETPIKQVDPRGRGIPWISSITFFSAEPAEVHDSKCLRIDQVISSSGIRTVEFVDPAKGFVVVRREVYYDNSTRNEKSQMDDTQPFKVEELSWKHDDEVSCWLLSRHETSRFSIGRKGDEVEAGVPKVLTIDFVKYDLQRAPSNETYSIGHLLRHSGRLNDNRERGGGKLYKVPIRSLVDPRPIDYSKYLPRELLQAGSPADETDKRRAGVILNEIGESSGFGGYCPVTFVLDGTMVSGHRRFGASHDGVLFLLCEQSESRPLSAIAQAIYQGYRNVRKRMGCAWAQASRCSRTNSRWHAL